MSAEKIWPVVPQRFHRGEAQHVEGAPDLIARLAQREAGFARDDAGEFVAQGLERRARLLKNLKPLEAAGCGIEGAGCSHCSFHILARGERDGADFFAVVGIADAEQAAAANRLTGDETGEVHARVPLQTKSKRSKLRGSRWAFAAYSGLSEALRRNGTISS